MNHNQKPKTEDERYFLRLRPSIFYLIFLLVISSLTSCQDASQRVTLALLGDIMLGRSVKPDGDSLAYLAPHLQSADLALANLESPLTTSPPATDSAYALCAPPERARVLSKAGLDILSLANNHYLDCGTEGLTETITMLRLAGLTPLGPEMTPLYQTIGGLKLAFLALEDVSSPLDAEAATEAIRQAGSHGALVILSLHWGAEYQGGASARQKQLAHQFAEAGATLIWGHHPHVLQPAEWLDVGENRTLVLYSLGNVLFDQYGLLTTRRSALVMIQLDNNGVQDVHVIPFSIDIVHSRVLAPEPAAIDLPLQLSPMSATP
ncbi:MAG: CapA family protein [Chloroflexota bacterium]